MKRSIYILSITFLICIISIIIGACAIGLFTKPELANPNLDFDMPTAFYILITIVWIGALVTGFRIQGTKRNEKNVGFELIFIYNVILIFFLN